VAGSVILGLFLWLFSIVETFWLHVILFLFHVAGFGSAKTALMTRFL